MATTLQVRKAIADTIRAGLPSLKTCAEFHGDLSPESIRSTITQSPAILVSALDTTDYERVPGQLLETRAFGALIVASGPDPLKRNDLALALVDALIIQIDGTDWGLVDTKAPDNIRSRHLFSMSIEMSTYALWLVSWDQQYFLDPEVDPSTLDDFLRYYADWDLAPPDGTVDAEDNLELPP